MKRLVNTGLRIGDRIFNTLGEKYVPLLLFNLEIISLVSLEENSQSKISLAVAVGKYLSKLFHLSPKIEAFTFLLIKSCAILTK